MLIIIGWVVVAVCVFGSFVLGGGHILSLLQPFEFMCIAGAAAGAFVVSNPPKTLKSVLAAVPACFQSKDYSKEKYLQLIALLYELLQKARQEGLLALEADVNDPESSPIYGKYPSVKEDHHLLEFINDYLRMMLSGNLNVLEIQELMDAELDTHHTEAQIPATAIQRIADAMPAFGIVAAVMGVVHTMGSVGAPPKVLGEMVAAALVGTFLGILLGYGFIGPLASLIEANYTRRSQEVRVREVGAARIDERILADRCRGVRTQGRVLGRPAELRRTRGRRARHQGKAGIGRRCAGTRADAGVGGVRGRPPRTAARRTPGRGTARPASARFASRGRRR